MEKQREYWIDWGKAIAIFAVVLCHNVGHNPPLWLAITNNIGISFHVALFYFISGYLFHIKDNTFYTFFTRSAKSLMIPYVFFNLLSAPILWKLQTHEVWIQGLKEFLIGKSHSFAGPAWFLVSLFVIHQTAYGLYRLGNNRLAGGIMLLLAFVPVFQPCQLWFGVSQAMAGIIFFSIGNIIKQYDIAHCYIRLNLIWRCTVLVLLLALFYIPMPFDLYLLLSRGTVASPLSYFRPILCVCMALSFFLLLKDVKCRMVEIISKGCIVIMGLHMTIVQVLWAIKGHLPEYLQWTCESPGITLPAFILSVIVAMLMMKYTPFLIGNRK